MVLHRYLLCGWCSISVCPVRLDIFYVEFSAIGSIAASLSVNKRIDYTTALTALITWGFFALIVAYASIKSIRVRRFFDSTPTILIQNGRIIEENLKKDLLQLMILNNSI